MAPTDRKTQGQKDDVQNHPVVRQLGRTRIELVPRDSQSVFVYWEVALSAPSPPQQEYVIELRRERGDDVVASHRTAETLGGEVIEVERNGRYWASLNLDDNGDLTRLARSTTAAGPLPASEDGPQFVEVSKSQGEEGLTAAPVAHEGPSAVEWNAQPTDASSR